MPFDFSDVSAVANILRECAPGEAETLLKLAKGKLASERQQRRWEKTRRGKGKAKGKTDMGLVDIIKKPKYERKASATPPAQE